MLLLAMGGSLACMLGFYGARKIFKAARKPKPRQRGIDPVGEAEVYLAYGRTKAAVKVLRQTVRDEPDNLEAKVTLLRAYSSDRNVSAYNSLAKDLQASLHGQAIWHTIQRNGRDMDPHNPLFNA